MTNSGEEDEEESCNTCQFMELIDKYTLGLFRKVAEGSFKRERIVRIAYRYNPSRCEVRNIVENDNSLYNSKNIFHVDLHG
jgi:hypothetical protein